MADAGEEALVAVEDIGPKVAASLVEHLTRMRHEIDALRELGVSLDVREEDQPPHVASDARWPARPSSSRGRSATPAPARRSPGPRSNDCARRPGATPARRFSASTDYLITGTGVGASKLTKAEKLGVDVVDQGEI